MALKIPFAKQGFSTILKKKLSGANVSLEYDNMESPLVKVGVEISELIGLDLYNKICDGTVAKTLAVDAIPAHDDVPEVPAVVANDETELNALLTDHLQSAMLNFGLYAHTIFLIAKIGNDGITIKKGTEETTIFKYQKDELDNKLINDAWFWMNQLIKALNENADKIADWKDSDRQKEIAALPVTFADFKKWVGVNSEYFMLNANWIIQEVWTECVLSRKKEATKTETIARAVCYETMARCCQRLSFYCLPENIRLEINNEMDSKNKKDLPEQYIREKVATQFQLKADSYWRALDIELQNQAQTDTVSKASTQAYKPQGVKDSDAYAY